MTKEIVNIKPEDYGLTQTKAKEVAKLFNPMLDKMVELEDEFNELVQKEITPEVCEEAKALRQKYVKVRTGTAKIHKELKAFYLQGGRFIDGWKNSQRMASEDHEKTLKNIEDHFLLLEAQKRKELQAERAAQVAPFMDEDAIPLNLFTMTEDVFNNFLTGVKYAHEQRIQAEKKAEEERIRQEKEEAERIRKMEEDNKRLREEAEAKEKALEKERKAREAKEAKERKAREAQEEKERKEREKIEAQARKEREEKERLQREIKAKEEAEKKAEEEKKKQSDKKRILSMVEDLEELKKDALLFKSKTNQSHVNASLEEAIINIKSLL